MLKVGDAVRKQQQTAFIEVNRPPQWLIPQNYKTQDLSGTPLGLRISSAKAR